MVKQGDWVLHSFEIKQVLKVEDGKPIQVSDGYFNTGGWGMEVYPLTLRGKTISEAFKRVKDEIYKDLKDKGIHYPNICRALESMWHETMQSIEDEGFISSQFTALCKFHDELKEEVESRSNKAIRGFKVFR